MQDDQDNQSQKQGIGPKFMAKPDDKRPKPKRFYKTVSVKEEGSEYTLLLDERVVKTPMKNTLKVPAKALAIAASQEWDAQKEHIDPGTMLLTKLINTALDRVSPMRRAIIDEITSFAGTDLLCYRALEPKSLVEKEAAHWDQYITWLRTTHQITLQTTSGITHVEQAGEELEKLHNLLGDFDDFALTAAHNITTLTGSAILTLALLAGEAEASAIWQAAHVDEDYQAEQWGLDEEAAARCKRRHAEFLKTHEFYQLSRKQA